MSTLSHTTKVTVRRAIKALQTLDKAEASQLKLLEHHGYQVVNFSQGNLAKSIDKKAGFTSRTELETFSRKHHLL